MKEGGRDGRLSRKEGTKEDDFTFLFDERKERKT